MGTRYEEQLEDCRKYKDFLDHLTPPEFFKEQAELKAKRQAERKARKEEKKAARLARFHDAQKAAAMAAAEEAAELGEDIEAAAAAVRLAPPTERRESGAALPYSC